MVSVVLGEPSGYRRSRAGNFPLPNVRVGSLPVIEGSRDVGFPPRLCENAC
jgi:hypothetical protein